MEDILSLIAVILISIIASAGSKKNREKKRQKKLERRQRRAAANQPAQAVSAGAGAAQASAKKPEPRDAQAALQREPSLEKRLLHLHSVSQLAMQSAGEGEDPCHPSSGSDQVPDDAPIEPPSGNELAQELLRGIIVSEILTRPCDRMALQRNKRRA